MKKEKVIINFILYSFLFFIPSFVLAKGGVSIIDTLNYDYYYEDSKAEAKRAKNNARKRYIKSFQACKGIKNGYGQGKVVALTFDDGPNGRYTRRILKILKDEGIKATFFFIGKNVEEQPSIVRMANADGHVIANHTYSHAKLGELTKRRIPDELTKASNAIWNVIGKYPLLFRPPCGSCSDESAQTVSGMGFETITWGPIAEDYKSNTNRRRIANEILKSTRLAPGAIIALHDGGGDREETVQALPAIISELKSKGYRFVTVPDLLGIPAYSYYVKK